MKELIVEEIRRKFFEEPKKINQKVFNSSKESVDGSSENSEGSLWNDLMRIQIINIWSVKIFFFSSEAAEVLPYAERLFDK